MLRVNHFESEGNEHCHVYICCYICSYTLINILTVGRCASMQELLIACGHVHVQKAVSLPHRLHRGCAISLMRLPAQLVLKR